jgi:tetratricopeptide (TPR) repeat protein
LEISFLPYQILPNLIFILAILGILIMILRRLPEAAAEAEAGDSGNEAATKLTGKGLPAVAISQVKSLFNLWIKKIWNFMLEAKDVKHQALAGYRIRKIFGGPQAARQQTSAAPQARSEQDFLEAIKNDPKNLGNYDSLGKFYLENSQIEDARDIYHYLTQHDAANADYYARLAYCYYQLKDFEKTAEYYGKSVALDSSQPNRYYNLGLVLEAQGKNGEARQALRQAITLEPNNPRYYISLSNVCLKLGAHDQALNALQKAHQFDPQNEKVAEKLEKLQHGAG